MKTRVLVVDDEVHFAESLAERLSLRDYDVTVSFSGTDALEKIKAINYDVIILDVFMPDMNGLDVLKETKKIKPLTEVVMLSGHAEVETAIEGMKSGAFDFVTKPADSEVLFAKIDKAYRKKADHEERIREAKVAAYVSSPRAALED